MGFHKLGLLLYGYSFNNSKPRPNSIVPIHQDSKPQQNQFFSNVDLVWKYGFRHGGQNKVVIHPPHMCL